MAKKLYGTDPDQVPTNADLGTIAYQDKDNLSVGTVDTTGDVGINTASGPTDLTIAHYGHGLGLGYEGATLPSLAGLYTSSSATYGQAYGSLIVKSRTDYAGYSIIFRTQSGEAARFNQSGNLAFPSGRGIDFSASAGSGQTSSLLDDYEEGAFVPVVRGRNTAGTGTYTRQSGWYTKVGRTVTIHMDIGWSAHTGSGGMEITMPFATGGGYQAGGFLSYNSGMTYGAAAGDIVSLWMDSSSSNLRFYYYNRSGTSAPINVPSTVSEAHVQIIYNT